MKPSSASRTDAAWRHVCTLLGSDVAWNLNLMDDMYARNPTHRAAVRSVSVLWVVDVITVSARWRSMGKLTHMAQAQAQVKFYRDWEVGLERKEDMRMKVRTQRPSCGIG